ncbi:EamA family transporter [Rhodoferax sp.]|uniref:DMT family transporter n=1 Tax=Rhodoferax sp. TaxID=50421 RepID=UPI00277AEB4A|nr:DMT family transporter [Rhodoferax sp.]
MTVVLITLAATLLIQLGYFLWKLSAEGQPRIGEATALRVAGALVTDWRWMLGFAATSVGWVLFVQATAMGDISLVQPLMSAGDLLLVILAVVVLKEHLVRMEWVGVLLTVLGAVALALEAQATAGAAFDGMRLAVLLGCAVLAGAIMLIANRRAHRPEILLALVVGLCFGAGSMLTKALTAESSVPGQSVVSLAILFNPLLLAVVLANVVGLVLLQAAFQRGRASVIVPLQLAMANAITVLAGVAIFGEHITTLRASGIVLIVAGTALLHVKPLSTQKGPA